MVRVEKIGCWGLFVTLALYGQQARSELLKIDDLKQMTLTQLLELEVITPSRIEQRLIDSAANITVLTQNMIRQRGYKNLVEILQDLPGFDFATYEDGGGEYPTHSLNRGIGGNPGNPKLLILVDGIAQNHIGFNWSQLFGEEQLYQDLERIEILQGPASAVYGANAFSGIIHFITQRKVTSNKTRSTLWFGQNNTRTFSAFHQSKIDNIHINGAFKLFKTDGDGGIGRPDPAGYFHNNAWPTFVSENFDADGNFHTGGPNPNAGQLLPNGFNTNKDNWSVRANINYFAPNKDNSQNGLIKASGSLFVWNKREGLGSYTPGYEYQSTAESFQMHHSAQLFSAEMDYRISPKLLTTFSAWYRQNRQLPQTGFQYSYRFPSLIKSYHSLNTQWGLEQQFKWDVSSTDLLLIGLRYIANDKMDQVTSLGEFQDGHDPVTTSSWSHATNQLNPQLGQAERVQVYQPDEQALYATYDGRFNSALSYSAGLRVDHSDDYNTTVNPRVGLIYQVPNNLFTHWNLKFLYGEAFREPSIFELTDEFRGNRNLSPEEIKTSEILSQLSWQTDESQVLKSINLKTSLFYSKMQNLISLIQSPTNDGGSMYANTDSAAVRGVSATLDAQFSHQLSMYINYQYIEGKEVNNWQAIDHTARNKWNIGFNWLTFDDNLNISLRTNIIGSRKAPISNGYYQGYAPGYEKTALTLTWQNWVIGGVHMSPQLVVKNLFDEAYAGVGRQDGRSVASQYDPLTNFNPQGFVPGYHPQTGRTLLFNVKIEF